MTLLFRGAAEERPPLPPTSLLLQWLMHHLTTQNQSVKLYNQMFPRGKLWKTVAQITSRFSWIVHPGPHVLTVSTAMLRSHSLNRPPGKGKFVSYTPLAVCVWRCWSLCSRHTSHRCALLQPRAPLSHQHSQRCNIIPFFLRPPFPRSSNPGPLRWAVLTSSPSMRYHSSSLATK